MTNDWSHLQICSLGTELVHVRSIGGQWRRAIKRWTYPYRDGAEHGDLGRDPIRFTLDAVFFGIGYQTHFMRLIGQMNTAASVYFTHPHHGTMWVRILEVSDRTSVEGAQYIEADIVVEEDSLDTAGFSVSGGGVAGAANLFDEAASAASSALGAL